MFADISILAWSRSSASSSITEPTGNVFRAIIFTNLRHDELAPEQSPSLPVALLIRSAGQVTLLDRIVLLLKGNPLCRSMSSHIMVPKGGKFQADALCYQFMGHGVPKGLHSYWRNLQHEGSSQALSPAEQRSVHALLLVTGQDHSSAIDIPATLSSTRWSHSAQRPLRAASSLVHHPNRRVRDLHP